MYAISLSRRAITCAAAAAIAGSLAVGTAGVADAATAPPATSSTVTPAVSCTGQTAYTKSLITATHTATEHGFFFTNNTQVCVGQANLRENFNDSSGLAERVRVRNGGASGPVIFHTFNNSGAGAGTGTLTFTTHVNTLFNSRQVTVCVALVNQSDHSVVDNVTICKTLP